MASFLHATSPRSSTSSSSEPSIPPLTPSDLGISSGIDTLNLDAGISILSPTTKIGEGMNSASYAFPTMDPTFPTFGSGSTKTPATPPKEIKSVNLAAGLPQFTDLEEDPIPDIGYSFGTCPSIPLQATPTAELGAFEYPAPNYIPSPPRTSLSRRSSLADSLTYLTGNGSSLGQIHARAQLVSTGQKSGYGLGGGSDVSGKGKGKGQGQGMLSPPASRRGSSCSTINTLPAGGRRPSVLHSVSIPGPGVVDSLDPLDGSSDSLSGSGIPKASGFYPSLADLSNRRPSLSFQQNALPNRIPPSLLSSRRGSLPASQLFGIPLNPYAPPQPLTPTEYVPRSRSSFSSGLAYGFTTTTPQLYHRRESMVSESGVSSSGSSRTIQEDWPRRGSFVLQKSGEGSKTPQGSTGGNDGGGLFDGPDGKGYSMQGGGGRRSSLPHSINFPPPSSLLSGRRVSNTQSPHKQSSSTYRRESLQTRSPRTSISGPSSNNTLSSTPNTTTTTSSPSFIPPSSGLAHHRKSRQHSKSSTSTRGSVLSFSSGSGSASGSSLNSDGDIHEGINKSGSESSTEEEDELEALPTPMSVGIPFSLGLGRGSGASTGTGGGGGMMFSDPWADSGGYKDDSVVYGRNDGYDSGEVGRRNEMGRRESERERRGSRPTLETIDSEETERGD